MERFIKRLSRIEEGILGLVLLAVCFFTFIETLLRYLFSYSFPWFQEAANYSVVLVTYWGAAIGVKYGTHFSMEALSEYATDRLAHLLKAIAFFLSSAVAFLIVFYGFLHVVRIYSFGVKSPALQMPMFIPYLAIPIFSACMAARFLSLSIRHVVDFARCRSFERVGRKSR